MAKKTDTSVEREELDADHGEPRVYEHGINIDCELPTEEAKKVYQSVRAKIADVGTVVAEGEPQKIQLAYTISRGEQGGRRDFDSSFFAWIAYETNGAGHEKVAEVARNENRIFRFIDVRTTKEGAEHSAQMHDILMKESLKPMPEEEVSDVEIDTALKEINV